MALQHRETRTARFAFDGQLMHATFRAEAEVSLADAREHLDLMRELTQGRPVRVMVDLRQVRSQQREARALYGSEESCLYTACCALLVASPLSRVVGSFFLGLNRPLYPTRLFSSEPEARDWLAGFPLKHHD
jgi:hypothetical protein